MKKIMFFWVLTLIIGVSLKAQITNERYKHLDSYLWQTSDWVLNYLSDYTYTGFGEILTATQQYTNPQTPSERDTYTYDENQQMTTMLHEEMSGVSWVPKSRERVEYYNATYPQYQYYETWMGGQWVVNSAYRMEYEFNGGLMTQMTTSEWNPGTSQFEYKIRNIYTYGQSNRLQETVLQSYTEQTWVNSNRIRFTWVDDFHIDYELMDFWVGTDWMNMSRADWDHLANGGYVYTVSNWDFMTASYKPTTEVRHESDSHGYSTLIQTSMKQEDQWSTVAGKRYTNTYQGNRLVERWWESWRLMDPEVKTMGGSWVKDTKEVYSNFITLGVEVNPTVDIALQVYPNPTSDVIFVALNQMPNEIIDINIVGLDGKILRNIRFQHEQKQTLLDVKDLEAGTYFIRVNGSEGTRGQASFVKY